MRAIIIGCGSIGARRARILKGLGVRVSVCDTRRDCAESLANELGGVWSDNLVTVLDCGLRFDVALICTPPGSHLELATQCAEAGLNLFIEKPLAPRLDTEAVTKLVRTMQERGVWAVMGFSYRFLPSLRAFRNRIGDKPILSADCYAGQFLADWHPNVDITQTYHAKEGEGGIVLDSLSHELDLVNWLFGEVDTLTALVGKTNKLVPTEDVVSCLVRMKSGAQVSVKLDYWQRPRSHDIRVVWADDGDCNTATWTFDPNEADVMYEAEMQHLVRCVERGYQGQPDIYAGILSTELLDAVRRSNGTWERTENLWAKLAGRGYALL